MKNIMKILALATFVMLAWHIKSQTNYNYNSLPDSLKKDAQYIVWEDKFEFEVINEGKAYEKGKFAVCITNNLAKAYNIISIPYRKDENVTKFEANIYDVSGKFVKKLKNSEIRDISAVSDAVLFEDDRMKYAEFINNEYPYTMVFEYEKKIEGLLHYPGKNFQSQKKSTVINSTLIVIVPEGFMFKYKEFNLTNKVKRSSQKGKDCYTWSESNILPERDHDMLPHYKYYNKLVRLAPINFIEGGYKGSLDTWEDFGLWITSLNAGRDELSADTKQKVNDLIKDAKSDREKIKILYEYMQGKTRYTYISLGIGGFQPYSADFVDSKGYGDCKALSNYMQTLLKAVKIKSYYTLVNAGSFDDDILLDFPSSQFNHVFLCVPMQKDTVWLECTNQKMPFNFLGSGTDNRHALMVTEDGGKIIMTPRYDKDVNTQNRKAIIEIAADGDAKGTVNTIFKGIQFEDRFGVKEKSLKEQYDFLKSQYPISGMEIKSLEFIENKDEIPSVEEKLELNLPMFVSMSSKRMFVKLNQFSSEITAPKNEDRKIPFQLRYEFADIDTVVFKVPEDFVPESVPKTIDLKTKFGQYYFSVIQDGNTYTCIRKYISEKNTYEASDYKAYYEYKKQVSNADKAKLVFVKKT